MQYSRSDWLIHVTPKQTSCYFKNKWETTHFKNTILVLDFCVSILTTTNWVFYCIIVVISHFHIIFQFVLRLFYSFLYQRQYPYFKFLVWKFQVNTQEAWIKMKIKYNKYIVQNYFNIIHEFDVCEIRKYITDCYKFNTCACNHCKGITIIYIYSCSVRIIMENILWRLLVSRVNQMSLCLDSYFYSYLVAIFTWT